MTVRVSTTVDEQLPAEGVPVSLLVDRSGRLPDATFREECAAPAVAVDCR